MLIQYFFLKNFLPVAIFFKKFFFSYFPFFFDTNVFLSRAKFIIKKSFSFFFLKFFYYYKFSFKGKGYKIKKKKKKIKFYFGRLFNKFIENSFYIIKKRKKRKLFFLYNIRLKKKIFLNSIQNIKKINIFNRRGIKIHRDVIRRKFWKKRR